MMEQRVLQHDAKGDGDPIVLVPGGLTGWLSWIPHQERLAERHRAIRVQPVHNELGSAGQIVDPSYDDEVERECLRVTLDDLSIEAADLAGWSAGARALIDFALAYPERVRTLTLIEPPATWAIRADPEMEQELAHLDAFSARIGGRPVSEDELAEFLQLAGFVPDASAAPLDPMWERWFPHRTALANQSNIGKTSHAPEELVAFDRPVLLVKGDATAPWLGRVVEALGRSFANATVLELPGDHACHIESIDAFLDAFERHVAAAA